jgi:GNAT superfamily N-acetyltransferase
MKKDTLKLISYTGEKKVASLIFQIAALRIEVFAEYPFLYAGELEYETRYLKKFAAMKDAIVVACFDSETLVGISTGFPFIYDAESLKQVLSSHGRNPSEYFCFGESVLRKSYRGLGIGRRFFEEREAHIARLNHYKHICFYTRVRPADDPKRPKDYRPLASFWNSMGYEEHPELVGEIAYQEIGEEEETPKKMVFWIKNL